MLLSFLERGNGLAGLSGNQLDFIHEQFCLYLIHAAPFNGVLRACKDVLDEDQVHLEVVLRQLLADMIQDYDCNALYKPAILRLAAGDATGFKQLKCPTRRTLAIIDKNKKTFKRRLKEVKFDSIGPGHLKSIEQEYLSKVKMHTYWFVKTKAAFLTIAEPGLTINDIVTDLQLATLVAFRRFYPFREGLYLVNTLKATVTNRGNSLITYSTAEVRRRLIQTDTGEHYSVESNHPDYENVGSTDPRADTDVRITLEWLRRRNPDYAPVIDFVQNGADQDKMLSWYARTRGIVVTSQADLVKHLKSSDERYGDVVAAYLKQPKSTVRHAFKAMAKSVA